MNRARGSVCSSSVSCCRGLGMGTCSSGEDLVIKARKPYTITKQREKWTEEEHSRFLEALKLHGRAWQRIEEHIGTKTAVQIRSHAQKFFSKLEKEAVAKGIPLGEVHDIEIPPPRPKRKPNNPYPRKICVGVVSSCVEGKDCRTLGSFSSFCSKEKATDLERCDPHEKHVRIKVLERSKETSKDRKSSESLLPFEDAERPSISSSGKVPIDACPFRDFVPLDKDTYDECSPTVKEKVPDSTDIDVGSLDQLSIDTEMKLTQERTVGLKQQQKCCISLKNDVGGSNCYPKHVSVHSIDGYHNRSVKSRESDATNLTSVYNKDEVHANLNLGTIPSISTTTGLYNSTSMSCVHLPFAAYPHFTQFFGAQDACRSFLNISSTFSSLIISTLLQNPAAHSAASLAASFWPTADVEAPIDSASETFVGGIPMGSTNSAQGMAAIAAATVAAASAWWATHGMLPFCHPSFHSCFTFAPAPASIIPTTETAQATVDNGEKEVEVTHDHSPKSQQIFDPEFSEAPGAKSSPLSSLEYDESHGGERPHGVGQKSPAPYQPNPTPDTFLQALARNKKKVDHSSCGSNVLSNSEMETENALKNLEQGREEPKEVHLDHPPSIDTNNRRSRGGSNAIESWKEVSEEGRLAFRALFSREVLPQSFSPRCTEDKLTENGKDKGAAAPHVELNGNACAAADNDHAHVADRNCSAHEGNNTGKVIQTNGIGQGKWKSHRTGFKPYKRCSMEAKENKADPVEEKCNKRIRLEGEAPM